MPTFYAYIEADPDLAAAYKALLEAIDLYEARGRPLDAMEVRRVVADLRHSYEQLGVRAAAKADNNIRGRIRQTQVRPDNTGNLAKAVESVPFHTLSAFPAGEVAIASIDKLDKGAVNPRDQGVYWRAQEYGLPVFPDQRPAPGYFMPGQARPDQAQFRVHPYFQQMPYARGMPALIRRRPLRARHFLRDGTAETVAWRAKEAARIIRHALSRLPRV